MKTPFKPIAISGVGSISPLGSDMKNIASNYQKNQSFLSLISEDNQHICGRIPNEDKVFIEELKRKNPKYKSLDNSVLYAIFASERAISQAKWTENDDFGINIGSSRGATELFEYHHKHFLSEGYCQTLASPTTTLGNIASWVAQALKSKGVAISHSITCSSALHAFANGIAWLRSGMATKFLVGASEAPLTDFTLAQMKALKIYAEENSTFPSLPLSLEKTKNTLVLGEGACVFCIEEEAENPLAYITGLGLASEILTHNVSVSEEAQCLQDSMKKAIQGFSASDIDVIITHSTGTIKGDIAEIKAIEQIFGKETPALANNKWKIGHTFGASGAFSVEMALLMLQNQAFYGLPYLPHQKRPKKIENILINALGFGGNACSILLSRGIKG